jgi:hypothetical protein
MYIMKRPVKSEDNMYHIKGKKFPQLIGSRRQVYHDNAFKTSGGLLKSDLLLNKHRRIVSRKKHFSEKKNRNLEKFGYYAVPGTFGYVNKNKRVRYTSKRKPTKKRV